MSRSRRAIHPLTPTQLRKLKQSLRTAGEKIGTLRTLVEEGSSGGVTLPIDIADVTNLQTSLDARATFPQVMSRISLGF